MQLQSFYANAASAAACTGQWISNTTSALGQNMSNLAGAATKTASVAMNTFSQWIASAKSSICATLNMVIDLTATYAVHALDFAKAHPTEVGLGVSALALTAILAVAYDRAQRPVEA